MKRGGLGKKGKKYEGEAGGGEVNRRRGRCSCLRCLCANNYPDEIHRELHEMQRKRRQDLGNTSRHRKERQRVIKFYINIL